MIYEAQHWLHITKSVDQPPSKILISHVRRLAEIGRITRSRRFFRNIQRNEGDS